MQPPGPPPGPTKQRKFAGREVLLQIFPHHERRIPPWSLVKFVWWATQINKVLATCFKVKFIGLAYQGKDTVFRFIIEYSSLRDFGP
jgi:hypothetical protein